MADTVALASGLNPDAPAYFPNAYNHSDVVYTSHAGLYPPLNYFSSPKSAFNSYYQQNSPHLYAYSFYTHPYPNQPTAPPPHLHYGFSVAPITETSHPGPVLDRTFVISDAVHLPGVYSKNCDEEINGGENIRELGKSRLKWRKITGGSNHGESNKGFQRPERESRGFYDREEWRPVKRCSDDHEEKDSDDRKSNIVVGDFGECQRPRRKLNAGCSARKSRQRRAVVPVCRYGENTTVMIKNIPSKYTREMLMDFLDNHCMMENQKSRIQSCNEDDDQEGKEAIVSAFDFLYLPIDFKNGLNKGYAFVNFTDPRAVWKFYLATKAQSWDFFNSRKRREIVYARLQGKEKLVEHFEGMAFPREEYLPVIYSPGRNGSRELVKESMVGRLTPTTWPTSTRT